MSGGIGIVGGGTVTTWVELGGATHVSSSTGRPGGASHRGHSHPTTELPRPVLSEMPGGPRISGLSPTISMSMGLLPRVPPVEGEPVEYTCCQRIPCQCGVG